MIPATQRRILASLHCLLVASLLAPACFAADATDIHFDSVDVTLKDKPFKLEVADTEDKRALGLMNRASMPADHGMLFVFDKPDKWKFWMKNTNIPLDIVFIDSAGKVVGVFPLKPNDETPIGPDKEASFAIELNSGTAKTLGLKVGDAVALPEKLLKAAAKSDEK